MGTFHVQTFAYFCSQWQKLALQKWHSFAAPNRLEFGSAAPTQRNFYKIQIRIGGLLTAHLHFCEYLIRGDAFLAMRCHSANSLPEWVDTTNDRIHHMMCYISWFACNMIIMLTVNQLLRFYEVTRHSTFCEGKVASMTYL